MLCNGGIELGEENMSQEATRLDQNFKSILVLFGDDDPPFFLEKVSDLAAIDGVKLSIAITASPDDRGTKLLRSPDAALSHAVDLLKARIPDVEIRQLAGIPSLEITREVLRQGHDLVVMSNDGANTRQSLFLGNTSLDLMRNCPATILVMKKGSENLYKRILAPIDPTSTQSEGRELNIKILETAAAAARFYDARLDVAHAWEVTGPDSDTLASEITDSIRERILSKHESKHSQPLDELLAVSAMDGVEYTTVLRRGVPDAVIPEIADETKPDLIVMGTVCRTGIPGFIIGNTAESILRQVRCSVLTLKPRGFKSSVTL
jgi:nucleotide-binding universal stress UspA family protein